MFSTRARSLDSLVKARVFGMTMVVSRSSNCCHCASAARPSLGMTKGSGTVRLGAFVSLLLRFVASLIHCFFASEEALSLTMTMFYSRRTIEGGKRRRWGEPFAPTIEQRKLPLYLRKCAE